MDMDRELTWQASVKTKEKINCNANRGAITYRKMKIKTLCQTMKTASQRTMKWKQSIKTIRLRTMEANQMISKIFPTVKIILLQSTVMRWIHCRRPHLCKLGVMSPI